MGQIHKFPFSKTRPQRKSIERHEKKVSPEAKEEKRQARTEIRRERRGNRQFDKKWGKWTSKG